MFFKILNDAFSKKNIGKLLLKKYIILFLKFKMINTRAALNNSTHTRV